MNTENSILKKLRNQLPIGSLTWIGLRPYHKGTMTVVNSAEALIDLGLQGDHRCDKSPGSGRQVTIISREYIEQIVRHLNRTTIDPSLLRRNLVIRGMNLNLLRHQHIRIGEANFELNALCHPCSRMNAALGEGGATAMYGYGGYCAKVIKGGALSVGDSVQWLGEIGV